MRFTDFFLSFIGLAGGGFLQEKPIVVSEKITPKKDFVYATFGVNAPIPIPFAGIGYRNLYGSPGFDISILGATTFSINAIGVEAKGLTFFEGYYMGLGGGIYYTHFNTYELQGGLLGLSPTACFGIDKKDGFHQFNLSWPSIYPQLRYVSIIPAISYQYGIKF